MTCYSDFSIISMTLKYKNSLSLAFLYFKYTLRFAITCFVRLQCMLDGEKRKRHNGIRKTP